jgi:hypothetical protein
VFDPSPSVAKDRISKTSHGFARNFTDASQESISALFTIGLLLIDAESTQWVEPLALWWELKKLESEK